MTRRSESQYIFSLDLRFHRSGSSTGNRFETECFSTFLQLSRIYTVVDSLASIGQAVTCAASHQTIPILKILTGIKLKCSR